MSFLLSNGYNYRGGYIMWDRIYITLYLNHFKWDTLFNTEIAQNAIIGRKGEKTRADHISLILAAQTPHLPTPSSLRL